MKKTTIILAAILFITTRAIAQNPLAVPDTLSGTNFNIAMIDTSTVFYNGFQTRTFGVNANYLGPTLILNEGDSININVHNRLMDTTTLHWHGLHVAAKNDGGPHITIPPGTVWSPGFKVRNPAGMYWYHPHLHMMTNLHATMGAAGVIIVRDSVERTLNLPRTYGVDDFPLVLQSKCFDINKQIVIDNASDSVMLVNGTLNASLQAPAQVLRFRLLNASSERVYNVGFAGNLTFHQIGTDGGLLNAPVALTRLWLAPGERAELLIDFGGKSGQVINLMSFASELPNAVYGAAQPGMGPGQTIPGYTSNVLNGSDFKLMTFNVVGPTALPVTTIPSTLVSNTPWPVASANGFKTLTFTALNPGPGSIQGPFQINNTSFNMAVVNYSVPFNNIEVWTLTNQSPIAHPFHIHDVHFFITEIAGAAPPSHLAGRKDVVLVRPGQTVKFIAKFESFCDDEGKYMYHCHMLTHEDDDMMGQFVVTCPEIIDVGITEFKTGSGLFTLYPNPANGHVVVSSSTKGNIKGIAMIDHAGKKVFTKDNTDAAELIMDTAELAAGIYIVEIRTGEGLIYKKLNIIK